MRLESIENPSESLASFDESAESMITSAPVAEFEPQDLSPSVDIA